MNHDEIKAVYDRGPDAVMELVERLFAIIHDQQQQIAALTARIKELEARLNTDSHNSNKPPSSDAFKKKSRSLRHRSGKPSGAQPGHAPHTLRRVDNPDQGILHQLSQCQLCDASLEAVAVADYQARQVFDLPDIKLEVTEHLAEIKRGPGCRELSTASFPASVSNPVQYGESIKALAVYLINYQWIPYRRTRELLADLVGQPLAEGTLQAALAECGERVWPPCQAIREAIRQAEVGPFDETGFYVEGKRLWLHVASTPWLTYYAHHRNRGSKATDDIGILPQFKGRAIHDGLRSYWRYGGQHGLCNAHHLRELTFLEEEAQAKGAGKMKRLLLEIKQEVAKAGAAGQTGLEPEISKGFEKRYEKIIQQGERAESRKPVLGTGKRGPQKQSKSKNLLDRLSRYRQETLAFMYDFGVPFDNNLAERDLRMMKVQQKISGCFRTDGGARIFCRIRSYISTMRKQGHNVLTALNRVFAGHPIAPIPTG